MPAPINAHDRLTVRVSPHGVTYRMEPAWLRLMIAALILFILAFVVFVVASPQPWPTWYITAPLSAFGLLVAPVWQRRLIADRAAADSALRAAAARGREVRPGVWRIGGAAAKPLFAQLGEIEYGGRTAVARLNASLDAAEPRQLPPDTFREGDPWPNLSLPPEPPEPWPLLRDAKNPPEQSGGASS